MNTETTHNLLLISFYEVLNILLRVIGSVLGVRLEDVHYELSVFQQLVSTVLQAGDFALQFLVERG